MATLYRHIAELRPDWKIVMFGEDDIRSEFPDNVEKRVLRVPGYRFNLWENVAFPILARLARADVMHCTSSSAPFLPMTPVVMTVHDIIPLMGHDGQPEAAVARFKRQLVAGLKSATAIIAVSQCTKDDLITHFKIDPQRVRVIHWGVDVSPLAPVSPAIDARATGIHDAYFLAFGGDAPRKNTERVVRAFARLPEHAGQLVLVGLTNPATRERLCKLAATLKCERRVVILGYVDDQTLEQLLIGASALIYVSLYEGFGLPLLEAMASGVPVIAGNVASIPEVVGDAASLVDPESVEQIERALSAMVSNRDARFDWAKKGRKRARQFKWQMTAQHTISLFESIVGDRC